MWRNDRLWVIELIRVYVTTHTTNKTVWEEYVLECKVLGSADGFNVDGRIIGEEDFRTLFVEQRGRVYKGYRGAYEDGVIGNINID